jgi:heat shock protein HslJ
MLIAAGALLLGSASQGDETETEGAVDDGIEGVWLVEDIEQAGVVDRLRSTLAIDADSRAFGNGGCNRFTGTARIDGAAVSFGPLASTRRMCPPAIMDQEQRFMAALGRVKRWSREGDLLRLYGDEADTEPLLRLTPTDET